MGESKCRCGNTTFETVDVTPVGVVDRKEFTRCSKCGLVVTGSDDQFKRKSTSKCSILRIVHDALERDKKNL